MGIVEHSLLIYLMEHTQKSLFTGKTKMNGYIYSYKNNSPTIGSDTFVAPNATIIGDVLIGAQSSIWFNCLLRGDVNKIQVGDRTNIQDGSIIHVSSRGLGTHVGHDVTIGHMSIIHGCTLEDDCFIGMGSIVMDNVIVESGAVIAAGSLITQGKRVLSGQLWAGTPASHLRDVNHSDLEMVQNTAPRYVKLAQVYRHGLKRNA